MNGTEQDAALVDTQEAEPPPAKRRELERTSDMAFEELQKKSAEARIKLMQECEKLMQECEKLMQENEMSMEEKEKFLQEKEKFMQECEEYEKLWQEEKKSLQEKKKLRQEKEKLRQEKEMSIHEEFPTMRDIVDRGLLCPPPNESNSSAHTFTGHRPAEIKLTLEIPNELGSADGFWTCRLMAREMVRKNRSLDSEADTRNYVHSILTMITYALSKHLGFDIRDVLGLHSCISLLDTVPDLGFFGPNKIIASTVEIKKDPRDSKTESDRMFGTDTEVQGEVYEQLYLVNTNNLGSGAIGLLTTGDQYMLVSLDNDISYDIEKIKNFFSKEREKMDSTPDPVQTEIFKTEYPSDNKQNGFNVSTQDVPEVVPDEDMKGDQDGNIKKDKNGNMETYKYGGVAAIASEKSANYSHYGSKVFSMRSHPSETVNLIAVFVLLTLRNLMNSVESANSNNIMEMTQFSARFVSEPNVFSLKAVTLSRPIDFLRPSESCKGTDFYAIRQLGFGIHGVCCLAFNKEGYACVLKFLRKHVNATDDPENVAQEAEEEAAMWKKIYGEKYSISAKVLQINDRVIIVMPYLQIPSTLADKEALCKGGKSSKLYRGLKQFCDAGYIHKDLHWHHVGDIPSGASNSDNPCLLCDLGYLSKHDMSEKEKEQWVDDAFTELKNRLN